ncbi:MAG: 8-oxo-dGTP diphosphatase [Halobacteriota archaeon]
MEEATLCFIVDGERVLLIEKLRGLGSGLYNGPGGKLEGDETPREAIVREVREEVGVDVVEPTKVGELTFIHDGRPALFVHVFRAESYRGRPTPTLEAVPAWFDRTDLPFDEMWDDDHLWLPLVLDGERFAGEFVFAGGATLDEAEFVEYDLRRDPEFA